MPPSKDKTILLLHHPVSKRDDRASAMLAARGYSLQWVCPGNGDALPDDFSPYVATVVYGGAENLSEGTEKWPHLALEQDWVGRWADSGKPFLGICLGAQLLAASQGAAVAPHADGLHEIGYVPVDTTPPANGFFGLPSHVYHWHKEGFEVPEGADLLLTGEVFANQAFQLGPRTYGIQFHPEVPPSVFGRWIENAAHMLEEPGAQPAAEQFRDAERYDAANAAWLDRFLDVWLEDV